MVMEFFCFCLRAFEKYIHKQLLYINIIRFLWGMLFEMLFFEIKNHWCIIPCCFFGERKNTHTNFPPNNWSTSTMEIPESLRSKIGSNSGSRKRRRPKSRRTRTAGRRHVATWRRSMVVHGGFFSSRWFWCHVCVCFFFWAMMEIPKEKRGPELKAEWQFSLEIFEGNGSVYCLEIHW